MDERWASTCGLLGNRRRRQRIFGGAEFGIELTARRRQHANAFGRDIDTFAGHELCLRIADGVRNDGDRQARVSEPARNYASERRERDAANRCGWNAEVFECGRVTRGPGGG